MGSSISNYSTPRITLLGAGSGTLTASALWQDLGSIVLPRTLTYEHLKIMISTNDSGNSTDVGIGTLSGNNAPDGSSANMTNGNGTAFWDIFPNHNGLALSGTGQYMNVGAGSATNLTFTEISPITTGSTFYIKGKSTIANMTYRWRAYMVDNS